MFDLKSRVAIVTGGSRGIGRAVAEALAGRGAHVAIGYARGEAEARDAVAGIVARGGSAEMVGFDVADWTAAEKAVTEVAQRHGRLDILVSNAGITIDGLLARIRPEDVEQVWGVNVKGALACAKAAIKPMMRAHYGRMVFVSSVTADMGNAGQVTYASTKAALVGITKSLAREYASRAITVNAVAPGFIDTDMTKNTPPQMREKVFEGIPLRRAGTPAEVAAAVVFLCSDEAGYVTGQVLRVNGGLYG